MGFFDDIYNNVGNFFGNVGESLFGTKTKDQGRDLAAQAARSTTEVGTQAAEQGRAAGQQAEQYDRAAKESMGGSAAEYMRKGQQAAQAGAEQAGTAAATAGTQAALRAQRSAGLSKGQAALASGQQAGDIYSNTYQQGLQSGQDRYQQATGQLASQGAQMAGRQQGALNTQLGAATGQANIGGQQQQAGAQTAQGTWGTLGTIAGAALMSDKNVKENIEEIPTEKKDYTQMLDKIAPTNSFTQGLQSGAALRKAIDGKIKKEKPAQPALPSDKNVKENIEELDYDKANSMLDGVSVDEIARKIRPVKYNYKEGVGTPGEKLGVIAQDLEETPLESMVKETPDGTKMIDTNELTGANLNLIIQLARKVASLEDQLKGAR